MTVKPLKVIATLLFAIVLSINVNAIEETGNVFPEWESEALKTGRSVWIGNCMTCHAYGTAGAPVPMIVEDWRERIVLPRKTLYLHALDGFYGPDDTYMPPKGGNPELSEAEVILAVDYMVELARYYQKQTEE